MTVDHTSLLAKRRSLKMSIHSWELFRDSPGYVKDRMVAVNHFRGANDSCHVAECIVSEAMNAGLTSTIFLGLLLDSNSKSPLEVDFGAGKFLRPNQPGNLLYGNEHGQNFIQGKGPFHSIYFYMSRDQLYARMAAILDDEPPSLEVLNTNFFRDVGLEHLMKTLAAHMQQISSTENNLASEDLIDDVIRRLVFVSHRVELDRYRNSRLPSEAIGRVIDYIHAHLDQDLKRDDLAKIAGVAPPYFTRLFSKSMGETPKRYLLRRRIERAQKLMKSADSDQTLAQVASACGFFDQSHFGNEFRRQVGISPSHYRRHYC